MENANSLDTSIVLRDVLSEDDLGQLKTLCKRHLEHEDPISSYVLIDQLDSAVYTKIKEAIEKQIGQRLLYLNDFYFYSDDMFGANWHMDTELFTFRNCVNAWILLSPDEIDNPLAFIGDLNSSSSNYFHSLKIEGEQATFTNYCNRESRTRSVDEIESAKIDTPSVRTGDILVLNPKKFHKTNVTTPKHAFVMKFIVDDEAGILSDMQVSELFWGETALFNRLLKQNSDWAHVLDGLREKLKTAEGRKTLNAGFFPEKIDLYKEMVSRL